MRCENCGYSVSTEDKFCTKCGVKLDSPNSKTNAPIRRHNLWVKRTIVGFAILVVIGGLGFGGKWAWAKYSHYQNEKRLSQEQEVKKAADKQAEKQRLERIKTPTAKVGDTVRMRDWDITVKDAVFTDKVLVAHKGDIFGYFNGQGNYIYDWNNEDIYTKPKGVYLIVTITAKNMSKKEDGIYFGDELFKLENNNDAVYQGADFVGAGVEDVKIRDNTFSYRSRVELAPEFSATGNLYYDVPTKDSQYRLILDDNSAIALN